MIESPARGGGFFLGRHTWGQNNPAPGKLTTKLATIQTKLATIQSGVSAVASAILAAILAVSVAAFRTPLTDPAAAFSVSETALVHARAAPAVDIEADGDILNRG